MSDNLVLVGLLLIIDTFGYIYKVKHDKDFQAFKLRKIPFIWLFYSE